MLALCRNCRRSLCSACFYRQTPFCSSFCLNNTMRQESGLVGRPARATSLLLLLTLLIALAAIIALLSAEL